MIFWNQYLFLVIFFIFKLLQTSAFPFIEVGSSCPNIECEESCPIGNQIKLGCKTCDCCPLPPCPVKCGAVEFVVGDDGCSECICTAQKGNVKLCPPAVCPDGCNDGVQSYLDEDGCSSCKCVDSRPSAMCVNGTCSSGCPEKERIRYLDANNCEQCACNIQCPPIHCRCPGNTPITYVQSSNDCLECGKCDTTRMCPPLRCPDNCPFGVKNEIGISGCNVCVCGPPVHVTCYNICPICIKKNNTDQKKCKECKCKEVGKNDNEDDGESKEVDQNNDKDLDGKTSKKKESKKSGRKKQKEKKSKNRHKKKSKKRRRKKKKSRKFKKRKKLKRKKNRKPKKG